MYKRGDEYDVRYEELEAAGANVHGEADFVQRWSPGSVLDAGCGTGRVARELARRGVAVVGFDPDDRMLDTARRKAPQLEWITAGAAGIDLGRRFDVVLMAGNVMNFIAAAERRPAIVNMARHLAPGGRLVAGHSIVESGCSPGDLDTWARESGLELEEHWSTWDRDPFEPGSDYSLSVHRRAPAPD